MVLECNKNNLSWKNAHWKWNYVGLVPLLSMNGGCLQDSMLPSQNLGFDFSYSFKGVYVKHSNDQLENCKHHVCEVRYLLG